MIIDDILNRRSAVLLLWLTIVMGGVMLFILEPGESAFLPSCLFRSLTGFQCPGCGSTRGLHQLLHGNLTTAFQLNPLLILALPFLLYALARYSMSVMRGQPLVMKPLPAKYIGIIVGAIVFFWIFRNTPYYPFAS